MNKFFIEKDTLGSNLLELHSELVLVIGQLEYLLQEFLIFLVLQETRDTKEHGILTDFLSHLSFDKKLNLVSKYAFFEDDILEKISIFRRKRNLFIHGILLVDNNADITINLLQKGEKEYFTMETIQNFLDQVKEIGGLLVLEFEAKGFRGGAH